MYVRTRSRDAINHYLPKFPGYCPAYRFLLALFQTFQYPFERGRSSLRQARVFSGHTNVRLQRGNANQNGERERERKKENALLFNPRNIASGESERSIRTDNRSLVPFDFYYRDSLSIPRGNHVPSSSDSAPHLFLLCFLLR